MLDDKSIHVFWKYHHFAQTPGTNRQIQTAIHSTPPMNSGGGCDINLRRRYNRKTFLESSRTQARWGWGVLPNIAICKNTHYRHTCRHHWGPVVPICRSLCPCRQTGWIIMAPPFSHFEIRPYAASCPYPFLPRGPIDRHERLGSGGRCMVAALTAARFLVLFFLQPDMQPLAHIRHLMDLAVTAGGLRLSSSSSLSLSVVEVVV
ncbi:hypothetical protein BR93DRAFT_189671 [Coniochaeta sp. PMI_546]|nr:hypothetical protein BR93DRAFT_189671 [Coniochaeta sp. PMI_546]